MPPRGLFSNRGAFREIGRNVGFRYLVVLLGEHLFVTLLLSHTDRWVSLYLMKDEAVI